MVKKKTQHQKFQYHCKIKWVAFSKNTFPYTSDKVIRWVIILEIQKNQTTEIDYNQSSTKSLSDNKVRDKLSELFS